MLRQGISRGWTMRPMLFATWRICSDLLAPFDEATWTASHLTFAARATDTSTHDPANDSSAVAFGRLRTDRRTKSDLFWSGFALRFVGFHGACRPARKRG